jgi:hypothetical protein
VVLVAVVLVVGRVEVEEGTVELLEVDVLVDVEDDDVVDDEVVVEVDDDDVVDVDVDDELLDDVEVVSRLVDVVPPGSEVVVVLDTVVVVVEGVEDVVDELLEVVVVVVVVASVEVVVSSVVVVLVVEAGVVVDVVLLDVDGVVVVVVVTVVEVLVVIVVLVVVIVVVVEVLVVVVVVVGHPQVKLPPMPAASAMGWLSASATWRSSMSRAMDSPGVQSGTRSARRMVAMAPVPGAMGGLPKSATSTLIGSSADGSAAEQTNPTVRSVQSAWIRVSSFGVSRSLNCMPRTGVAGSAFAKSMGTSMSIVPGSAQRLGRLTVTPARARAGAVRATSAEARRACVKRRARNMMRFAPLNRVRVAKVNLYS